MNKAQTLVLCAGIALSIFISRKQLFFPLFRISLTHWFVSERKVLRYFLNQSLSLSWEIWELLDELLTHRSKGCHTRSHVDGVDQLACSHCMYHSEFKLNGTGNLLSHYKQHGVKNLIFKEVPVAVVGHPGTQKAYCRREAESHQV